MEKEKAAPSIMKLRDEEEASFEKLEAEQILIKKTALGQTLE